MKEAIALVSRTTAEHYCWGTDCDGWHLFNDPKLSIILERMPPGASEIRHVHRRALQFFFVLSGALEIEIDSMFHVIEEGAGIAVPPGTPHQVVNASHDLTEFLVVSKPHSHGDREPA